MFNQNLKLTVHQIQWYNLHSDPCICRCFILRGTNIDEITHIKTLLNEKFSIDDLLQDTGLSGAKPCSTPMQPHLQLHKESGTPLFDPTAYKRLIGRVIYLTHSRTEISYVISKLS